VRGVGILVVVAAVACSTHEAMKTPDAAPPLPDACPIPIRDGECLVNGFLQVDPNGMWLADGTSTGSSHGSAYTTSFERRLTIARTGCSATMSDIKPTAYKLADGSVIEFKCDQNICPREVSTTYVCVRASDGALIYVRDASYTSTMPGNEQSNEHVRAVLTRVP
jgi:hypothetical protein